jgi:hypothetical protein
MIKEHKKDGLYLKIELESTIGGKKGKHLKYEMRKSDQLIGAGEHDTWIAEDMPLIGGGDHDFNIAQNMPLIGGGDHDFNIAQNMPLIGRGDHDYLIERDIN